MKLIMEQWRKYLLKEDPMGFVQQLAGSGKMGLDQIQHHPLPKPSGRELKDAFRKHADHEWLSSLQTTHWTDPWSMEELHGKGKDELSTTMALPGQQLAAAAGMMGEDTGLLVRGRITLATNDQDNLYSGIKADYSPDDEILPDEKKKKQHRAASSGLNKRPMVSKDYSRYGGLKKGTEFGEKMARNIPYVLDQSTWDPASWNANEALVDNWKPLAVVVTGEVADVLSKNVDQGNYGIGKIKQIFGIAMGFGVSIVDGSGKKIWSPESK